MRVRACFDLACRRMGEISGDVTVYDQSCGRLPSSIQGRIANGQLQFVIVGPGMRGTERRRWRGNDDDTRLETPATFAWFNEDLRVLVESAVISRRSAIASGFVSALKAPAAGSVALSVPATAQTAERPTVINAHHTR